MNNYDKINYRQKGRSVDGKVVKGFIQSAHQKLSTGSIPSKFETIIYKNTNNKAFGSSSGRFFDQEDDKPAPGQYQSDTNSASFSTMDTSQSISKKGYGNGFTSVTFRTTFQNKYLNSGPGPGYYDSKQKNELLESRTSNLKGSSCFLNKGKQIGKTQSLPQMSKNTPGPAEYTQNPKYGQSVTTYNSAFISKTKRAQYMNIKPGPGAGEYNIKRGMVQKKPYPHMGTLSSFAPPINKNSHKHEMLRLTKFLDENQKVNIQGKVIQDNPKPDPGPGQYEQNLPEFQSDYFKNQANSYFKEGIKTRFGDFKDTEKQIEAENSKPAPGAYKVEDAVGFNTHKSEKAFVNCPFGMSETIREPYGKYFDKIGPNPNVPFVPSQKKSFHLNLARKWV